ncbi:hypothetical protein [Muricoccus radiodurans]|uniref:hypothetical protein n=1 Tax=Muricoccus radiodurans TaxID=2231721 RepID=UPI003CF1FA52
MVELHFWADFGMVPARLVIRREGFDAAFEAFRAKERDAGRKATHETFCEDVGVNERVLRRARDSRARDGRTTLPRHQVEKMAERLGCRPSDIVEDPGEEERRRRLERDRRELAAWPVPLRRVESWVDLVGDLGNAGRMDFGYGDDVVDLATASAIDAFGLALDYARRMMSTHRAVAAATLKDAAADLEAHGLHVLAGRFMGRGHPGPDSPTGGPTLHRSLVFRIRRETEDPAFTVDRSAEPLSVSDEEDWFVDDGAANDAWLSWEGKRRLALWPENSAEDGAA